MSAVQDLPVPSGRRGGAFRLRIAEMSARHRSMSIVVGMAIVAAVLPVLAAVPPFSSFQTQNSWIDGFTNAGVFVLLALGLNLVVGVAGLLDLGYAAFFAIGAYAYAYAASPFGNEIIGIDIAALLGDAAGLIFWPMLIIGALVAATFGILLGAPTLRLRGDYLAIVTLEKALKREPGKVDQLAIDERIEQLSTPLRAAFMPLVPHASIGRRGVFNHTSQP